ncbi:MAG: hypothetical protein ACYDAL_10060 [Candidatus Dormibacteraceae bacterium]
MEALSVETRDRATRARLQLIVWVVSVGFGAALGVLSWVSSGWTTPLMVLAVIGLGAFYVRVFGIRAGLVLLLLVASVVDRFTFRAGPVDLRAEEIAGLCAFLAVATLGMRDRSLAWLRPTVPELVLIAWFACSVISSVLASPDKKLSAKIIALVAVCALGFLLPRRILTGRCANKDFETVTRWLLIVFATESAYGMLAYLLHVFGPTISIAANPASGHLAAYGTLWEQNVFGGFAAAGAVAWSYLGRRLFRHPWIGIAACTGALIDSITRTAWLVAAAVAALGLALPGLRRRLDFATLGSGTLALLAVIGATLAAHRLGNYVVPVRGSTSSGHGSFLSAILNLVDVVGRVKQLGPIQSDIRGHLVLGRGTASFEALHVTNGIPEHVASLPLLILNDTGLLGLVAFGAFAATVFIRAWSRRGSLRVAALGQVALVIGLTNLATETTELMIGWLLVGLLMAACEAGSNVPTRAVPAADDPVPT